MKSLCSKKKNRKPQINVLLKPKVSANLLIKEKLAPPSVYFKAPAPQVIIKSEKPQPIILQSPALPQILVKSPVIHNRPIIHVGNQKK